MWCSLSPSAEVSETGNFMAIIQDDLPPSLGSATRPKFPLPDWVLSGGTTDIYFRRAQQVLEAEGLNPICTVEFFTSKPGLLSGIDEALQLIEEVVPPEDREVEAIEEGSEIERKEVVMRVRAPYRPFGLYETPLLGILSHCTGWATAARECVEAAGGIPVVSFGARHVHPLVSGRMEYSAVLAGCQGCASIDGAALGGSRAHGDHAPCTDPGDGRYIGSGRSLRPEPGPGSASDSVLVDTFKDEAEESLRVARAMRERLAGVRVDTPWERGRVTAELVKEIRARLDLEGFNSVRLIVSGGLDPDRIRYFRENDAPVDSFGVGGYISNAGPINFTADIHEVDGKAIAKRGRIPGLTANPRLKRVM